MDTAQSTKHNEQKKLLEKL